MSLVSRLNKDTMECWCPACGERVEVNEDEFCQVLPDGDKEYYVYCSECGQTFYAAESY